MKPSNVLTRRGVLLGIGAAAVAGVVPIPSGAAGAANDTGVVVNLFYDGTAFRMASEAKLGAHRIAGLMGMRRLPASVETAIVVATRND